MRLLFKQRMFSWFDSYDIYDENGNTVFVVKGKLSWGHCLEIFDQQGKHLGTVKEEILTFLPRFSMYAAEGRFIGAIKKEFTLFRPAFHLDCNGWRVQGDLFSWDYEVDDHSGNRIMTASKQLFNLTDTYVIDIIREENKLMCLMIVLAIDAAKCTK